MLVSKNNVDIKFKEFFMILEGYFGSYEQFCRDSNNKTGDQLSHIFGFCSNYVEDLFYL